MRNYLLISLLLISPCLSLLAKPTYYFDYSPLAKKAYQDALRFRFKDAEKALAELNQDRPNNLIVHHIESYIDLFKVYIGAEDYALKSFKNKKAARLQEIKKGDPKSPFFLFVESEIRLHAALARWKHGEYLGAFQDIIRAYKLLEKNKKRFPDFLANDKDLSMLRAFIGTIPNGYQWGLKLLTGMEGSIEGGLKEMKVLLDKTNSQTFIFKEEAEIVFYLLQLHLKNDRKGAWGALKNMGLKPKSSMLHCYILADVGIMIGETDAALKVLSERPRGKNFYPFYYLDYLQGIGMLRKLNPQGKKYFKQFLNNFKGTFHVRSAYQKIAWLELLNGNLEGYHQNMAQILELATDSKNGADQNAYHEAKKGVVPNSILLKARLLFDGGYYLEALNLFESLRAKKFKSPSHQVEFLYRQGRIYHQLEQYNSAIRYYKNTLAAGRDLPDYFACNAALQLGLIYEFHKDKVNSAKYYNTCLEIKPNAYKNSLHQQAKAGLNRIKP